MSKKAGSAATKKAKGRRLQQWVANKISKLTGIKVGKDCLIASREMGQTGVDVRLIGKALRYFPFSVECKNQETWSIPAFVRQAKENKLTDTDWLLICKRNHEDPVVILDADTFFRVIIPQIRQNIKYELNKGRDK